MRLFQRPARIGLVVVMATLAFSAAASQGPGGGMRVYKDAESGKFVPPPPEPAATPPAAGAVLNSPRSSPPPEIPSHDAAGGVMVELNGRYRTRTRAVKDAEGRLTIECVLDPVGADSQ